MKSHEFSSSSGPKKKIDHSPESFLWSMDVRVIDKAVKRGVVFYQKRKRKKERCGGLQRNSKTYNKYYWVYTYEWKSHIEKE